MGSNSLSQDILEGSNVYFECDIKANPYVDVFGWKLNGEIFNISTISGLEERNTSLLITNVNHRHYGQYQCYAANSIGQSESESVFLDIKCLYQF
ncbi:Immunoglobulin C-2 domain containing protein [Sarcoptes scabiei]|uniref:Immunoglobulin C-2 domain containing protein n=1 Tax=Sarcoptes scabiei TaxID=52283 RepID=A0A132A4F2_SARSC|nr:Immunoglobulin C-2 domain containing protein [Sarcoptes scabiei]